MTDTFSTKQRLDQALEALRLGLSPYVAQNMAQRHGAQWRHFASRASGSDPNGALDAYALLKTILDNYAEVFRHDAALRKARSFVSLAYDARNASSHFDGTIEDREALRYLDAIRELLAAVKAKPQVEILDGLYKAQIGANPQAAEAFTTSKGLREPEAPDLLRPWREVAPPHADVLEARYSDAEFAANLALVDQGIGRSEYTDPRDFFRITYLTTGLARVLERALQRFAGSGGDPVIGLQTNFGGGKTHTMLALYHLAGAAEAGYDPKTLPGLAEIFSEAGVEALGPVKRAVFVGSHRGPSEEMHAGDGRLLFTLWGYIAWRLGGWEAVDSIQASEKNRTNPGSAKLIPILEKAAPCLILLDEVVAFAKQLKDQEYEAFHAFIQSLTEAAAAVPGAMVVGSLPESRMEVGDERGVDALRRLEKLFGRVQSAWTPAQDLETFEIVRRRLFQPLDEEGEKARDAAVKAFAQYYHSHKADLPPEATEPAYREQMKRAYPLHPEVLKRFSEDWSVLEKFQRTRGILKIMANVIYALWRGQSNAPVITLAQMPLDKEKVRTAILEPLDRSYGPIVQSEVDGDLSLAVKEDTYSKRLGDVLAHTRTARTVFMATAPHCGASTGRLPLNALRLACAQPGDKMADFSEALNNLVEKAAYLYRDGDSYWFSIHPTLNRVAENYACEYGDEEADEEIVALMHQEEAKDKGNFHRLHIAPDEPLEIEDSRLLGLMLLPPPYTYRLKSNSSTPAERLITDVLQRRGGAQRMFRNSLLFIAPDENSLATCRQVARSHRAWKRILADKDLRATLTFAQIEDAENREHQTREGLRYSIRTTWRHILCPAYATDTSYGTGINLGFKLQHSSIKNNKPIAPVVFDKAQRNGEIAPSYGTESLLKDLKRIWFGKPHIPVATLIDWYAQYLHLPRMRDEVVLLQTLGSGLTDAATFFGFATAHDEASATYEGVRRGCHVAPQELAGGLLVRLDALPEPEKAAPLNTSREEAQGPAGENGKGSGAEKTGTADGEAAAADPTPAPPRRFFGAFPIDPGQPGVVVANIAKEILVELNRPKGTTLRLTLEVEAVAPEGYDDDTISVIRDNIRTLKLNPATMEFEAE